MAEQKEPEEICTWKIVFDKGQRGEGRAFEGRTPQNLKCYNCDGTRECSERLGCDGFVLYEKPGTD